MIRRVLTIGLLVGFFAAPAFANDIDRHGDFTAKDAAGATSQKCKSFVGTDDNRTACSDWCSNYLTANAGTTCACDEGACAQESAPVAAAAPPAAQ
jgi:hypothetical protein